MSSNIKISKKVMDDLFNGKANYIKGTSKRKRLLYNQICFGSKEITFRDSKNKVLATLKLPENISLDQGDTVTLVFNGSMDVHFE